MERPSGGSRRIVLQRVQRQVRGRHQGSRSHSSGNGQLADGPASVGRAPVQSGTVGGDQKPFWRRPDHSDGPTGNRFRGSPRPRLLLNFLSIVMVHL